MNLPVEYGHLDRFPTYRFGDDGSVWNWKVPRREWRLLKSLVSKNPKIPYLFVSLRNVVTDKRERRAIHLLVAEVFLGPKPSGMVCRHLDGNPRDPRLVNLAYGTWVENEADKILHGTKMRGERHHQAKLTTADIRLIRSLPSNSPLPPLARRFGVTPQAIWRIRNFRTWRHV